MAVYHAQTDRGIALLQKEIDINPHVCSPFTGWERPTPDSQGDEAIAPLQKSIWLNPTLVPLHCPGKSLSKERGTAECRKHVKATSDGSE
jgi:hypothetical protein